MRFLGILLLVVFYGSMVFAGFNQWSPGTSEQWVGGVNERLEQREATIRLPDTAVIEQYWGAGALWLPVVLFVMLALTVGSSRKWRQRWTSEAERHGQYRQLRERERETRMTEAASLREEQESLQREYEALQGRMATMGNEMLMEHRMQCAEERVSTLENELSEARGRISQLEQELHDKDVQEAVLEGRLERAEADKRELDSRCELLSKKIARLSKRRRQMTVQLAKWKAKKEGDLSDSKPYQDLVIQLASSQQQLGKMQGKFELINPQEHFDQAAELASLKEAKKQLTERLGDAEQTQESLLKVVGDISRQLSSLEESVSATKGAASVLDDFGDEVERIESAVARVDKQVGDMSEVADAVRCAQEQLNETLRTGQLFAQVNQRIADMRNGKPRRKRGQRRRSSSN